MVDSRGEGRESMGNFASCGMRRRALPYEPAAFEKAGETFNIGCGGGLKNLAVQGCRVVLTDVFGNIEHLNLHGTLTEGDLDDVPDLDLIRGLGLTAIDYDVLTVTGIICHGAALNQARNL